MLRNRLVYLTALITAVSFYFASGVWFSWALVFVLLILPPVSLLCSLPQMLCLRLSLFAPQRVEQGERFALHLTLRTIRRLPMLNVTADLYAGYRNGDKPERRRFPRIPREGGTVWLDAEQPGLMQFRVRRVRAWDMLGLIWLPKRVRSAADSVVLPLPLEPQPEPDFSAFRALRLKALAPGTFSETYDNRPYRDGDNVRSISWKLSQKTEELIVREPVAPVRLRCAVVVTPAATLPALRSEWGQLRRLEQLLLAQKIPFTLCWYGENGVEQRTVTKETEAENALADCCRAPLPTGQTPTIPDPDADWCYRVTESEAAG